MTIYYRISDKGNPKEKLPHAGKRECLENAVREFGSKNIYVIADNCEPETIQFIKSLDLKYETTSLGNSASFIYMVERIIKEHRESDTVYLLEDDYIHLNGSKTLLEEGLEIADYVTLYDHPDKYKDENDGGNPLNYPTLHSAKIFVTKGSHWRETDSTTMTFACKVSTLKEDLSVWKKYTQDRNPDDFHGFMKLTNKSLLDALSFLFRRRKREFFIIIKNILFNKKTRLLISALPARSTHAEIAWLSPVVNWSDT